MLCCVYNCFKENISYNQLSGDVPVKISFNVKLLLDVLKNMSGDDLRIEFNSELSPCIIRSDADEGFIYIIMPIRTSDYQNETKEVEEVAEVPVWDNESADKDCGSLFKKSVIFDQVCTFI